MGMKAELQKQVVDFLKGEGIAARVATSQVAVSRDSMCQSQFSHGLDEGEIYSKVLSTVRVWVGSRHRLHWACRSDDDLFIDALVED